MTQDNIPPFSNDTIFINILHLNNTIAMFKIIKIYIYPIYKSYHPM